MQIISPRGTLTTSTPLQENYKQINRRKNLKTIKVPKEAHNIVENLKRIEQITSKVKVQA